MDKKLPKTKADYRKFGDDLWRRCCVKKNGQDCEVCGKPASDVHHFFPRNSYGALRFEIDNGIILCRGEHFKHHFKSDPTIHEAIIRKRGQRWFDTLKVKAEEKFISGKTIQWYKTKIEELTENL